MVTLAEIEMQAMKLSESERAMLASSLLESLPPLLDDADDGIAEAMRRDAEMDRDPSIGMTLDQLRTALGR